MRAKSKRVIKKLSQFICSMAILVVPIASQYCRVFYYQPKEPEGLNELLKK